MANITETKMTSTEIGLLWTSYQINTLLQQMLGFFAQKTADQKSKELLDNYVINNNAYIAEIKQIFEKENAVVPQGFDSRDVFSDAPALFDDIFNVMFLRLMVKVQMGFCTVHTISSFRQDVRDFFARAWNYNVGVFNECTDYLTEQGVLARPPYMAMPKQAEFIEEKDYMSGYQFFRKKRTLNTVELSYIFQDIETNILGMQLATGFAQVAKEKEVREYFMRGKELAKKIISEFSALILDSDIQAPATWAGKATESIISPFSDKMMMYLFNILTSSSMYINSAGLAFSMRSDLPVKLAWMMIDNNKIAREGGMLMIEHKWLEEPPQLEDRNQLIRQ